MNSFIKIKNNQTLNIGDIPLLHFDTLYDETINTCLKDNTRLIGFFGVEDTSFIRLFILLSDDKNSDILVSSSNLNKDTKYPSFTRKISAFHMFERDFYEEFGTIFIGHPWLKYVNYRKNRHNPDFTIEKYPFFEMKGEDLHEVAVGPIHAGIIEPGHFRFICSGEKVYHLEIQLGYQHRNVEKLILDNKKAAVHIAESIVGDSVIAHTLSYLNAVESLSAIEVNQRAQLIRVIALEVERIAMHLADLGAIANDVAYLMGSAVFGTTRTLVINTLLSINGNRFGRGLLRVGGTAFDITHSLIEKIRNTLAKVSAITNRMAETMFSCPSVLSRLDKTGIVSKIDTEKIGAVGMAARASGVKIDSRINHPFGPYKKLKIKNKGNQNGDVFARAYLRYTEINESIELIKKLLEELERNKDSSTLIEAKNNYKSESMAISIVEGWRGEVVHVAITNKDGKLIRYKIKDPSFNNWFMLAVAVRNNGISDFPLCNKSFNLSYCGNDL